MYRAINEISHMLRQLLEIPESKFKTQRRLPPPPLTTTNYPFSLRFLSPPPPTVNRPLVELPLEVDHQSYMYPTLSDTTPPVHPTFTSPGLLCPLGPLWSANGPTDPTPAKSEYHPTVGHRKHLPPAPAPDPPAPSPSVRQAHPGLQDQYWIALGSHQPLRDEAETAASSSPIRRCGNSRAYAAAPLANQAKAKGQTPTKNPSAARFGQLRAVVRSSTTSPASVACSSSQAKPNSSARPHQTQASSIRTPRSHLKRPLACIERLRKESKTAMPSIRTGTRPTSARTAASNLDRSLSSSLRSISKESSSESIGARISRRKSAGSDSMQWRDEADSHASSTAVSSYQEDEWSEQEIKCSRSAALPCKGLFDPACKGNAPAKDRVTCIVRKRPAKDGKELVKA
eukprot:680463-Hanusia_phi.AAC.3